MPDRPNIVFITSHDTGRHFGCYGVAEVNTPAVDGLAADGCLFTGLYSTSAFCCPSRASMMSGLYGQRNGVMSMVNVPFLDGYKDGVQHISHVLRDAGYHTAMFHIHHEAYDIDSLGFEASYARWTAPDEEATYPVTEPVASEPYLSAAQVADEFVEFVKEKRPEDRPFYAQIGFTETHDWGSDPADVEKGVYVPDAMRENKAHQQFLPEFQGVIRAMDSAINTIYEALEQAGLADNTIFIYTSDHGIVLGGKAKMYLYDAGIEVSLVMRWPQGGIVGGRTCDWLLSNVDLFPTVLELAGVPVPEGLDGISFAGCFGDEAGPGIRDAVFAQFPDIHLGSREARSIRTERYKLIRNFFPTTLSDFGMSSQHLMPPFVQLFDLVKDPGEWDDVAGDPAYRDVRVDLNRRLMEWMTDVNDSLLKGPRPTHYHVAALEDFRKAAATSGTD